MGSIDNSYELKKLLADRLNAKYPDFEKNWTKIVQTLGSDFVGIIKENFQKELKFFNELSKFKLSIVIDNNFIFGQIKNLIEKDKKLETSFVYKLVTASYINVYAPYKLKEELIDKIDNILKNKHDLAHKYANVLLDNIIIKDAFWIDEWKKANNLIGHIDKDDVPYLALSFHVESHGIISNDKIFHKQNHSKAWNIQDVDKIITSYNSGFISFCFLGSVGMILKLIWDVIVAVFKVIGEILIELITGIGLIVGGVFSLLGKIPPEIGLILLGLGALGLMFSPEFRQAGQNALIKTGDFIKIVIEKMKDFLDWISSVLSEFWELFKPIGLTSLEIIGYLTMEYNIMKEEVQKLEKERAQ